MAVSSASNGALADVTIMGFGLTQSYAGNGEGGMSTGIGVGSGNSGAPAIQSTTSTDFAPTRIGGGSTAVSASNLGNVVQSVAFAAGSGYTNGSYAIDSTGGGAPNGTAQVQVTVAGGAITAVVISRAGSGFASAPTFALTALGAGTGGSITPTIGTDGRANMLGSGFGTNKGTRYLTAAGSVANGAAVSGGYLNRSGRAMVAGESTWAVAP